jgi:hypothetical protein
VVASTAISCSITARVTSERRRPPLAQANKRSAGSHKPMSPSLQVASRASHGVFGERLLWGGQLAAVADRRRDRRRCHAFRDRQDLVSNPMELRDWFVILVNN